MTWLSELLHKITNYDNIVSENNSLRDKYLVEQSANKLLTEQLAISYEEIETVRDELEETQEELENKKEDSKKTEIDLYCETKGYPLKRIAYQNKRQINDKPITVFLHELITPESYEVYNLARKISDYTVKGVGTYVSKYLTWKDDKQFNPETKDYFLYPSETIVNTFDDCEGHAFVCASLMPKTLGVAYGFVNLPDGNSFGHAFNVYINNGKLFLLDTVENYAIIKDVSKHYYTINYIVTQKGTYVVDGSVKFGLEAR